MPLLQDVLVLVLVLRAVLILTCLVLQRIIIRLEYEAEAKAWVRSLHKAQADSRQIEKQAEQKVPGAHTSYQSET